MVTLIMNLLMLPDEILLEIYKYLLDAHVLYSFYGLNRRLNISIASYCHRLSLADVTYSQFHYLCRSVLPQIGHQLNSLLISNCRSVLQGKIFSQYFSKNMSEIFPNLQKITLVCYTADELDIFLYTLNNLQCLDRIEICDLLTDQSNSFQRVIETNDYRFTSIKFKTSYSDLPTCSCLHLCDLTVSMQTLDKFVSLLLVIPNIQKLNVTIDEVSTVKVAFDHLVPLLHLRNLFLRYYNHFWLLTDLKSLIEKLPAIEVLSLELSSKDRDFVSYDQKLFQILPQTIQQFNLSLRYFYDKIEEIDRTALMSTRFPIICLVDETLEQAILHTIPYRFRLFSISHLMAGQMAASANYEDVDMFYDHYDMTLLNALPIIARCRRIREIAIQSYDENDVLRLATPVKDSSLSLPTLFRLKRIWLLHSSREYDSLKAILQIAPNLIDLFIAFDNLQPIFNDEETCQLLGSRINHLLVLRSAPTAPTALTEEYIPHLGRVFTRLRQLQIDVTGGPSIETIVQATLNVFKEQSQLISLVVEGQTRTNEIKCNARQWLIDNTHLTSDGMFDSVFKQETNRFLLWM